MPIAPDSPLRKVTLRLYEDDIEQAEIIYGHGWSAHLRQLWHTHLISRRVSHNPTTKILGDLENDPL
jgi:hypothetical protein